MGKLSPRPARRLSCRSLPTPRRFLGFSALLVALVRLYQRFLSPALPVVTLGACACRFSPSCSEYAVQALQRHGPAAGLWLAVCRLVRCTPLHAGGFDPVPPQRHSRPASSAPTLTLS